MYFIHTRDGQSTSEKLLAPGLNPMDDQGHSRKPQGFGNLIHQAMLQIFFFFFPLISEGEDK